MKNLSFFEKIYHFLSGSKNLMYDSNLFKPEKLSVPVVSVGNLSFGGVGKTPCIMVLAQQLALKNKICIVTKSYKVDLKKPARVDLSLPRAFEVFGDEACLLKLKLPFCEVWSGPSKLATAQAAMVDHPSLILVDDGFSHRKLARNFDLVLIDATQGFETYLRESIQNLKRANAAIITKINLANSKAVEKIIADIQKIAPNLKNNIFTSSIKTTLNLDKADPLFAFCGLARPENFLIDLKKQGYQIEHNEFYPDHFGYTLKDQKRIYAKYLDLKNQNRNLKVVTTEKDFVKIDYPELLSVLTVAHHELVMDESLMEVLVGKIRKSF